MSSQHLASMASPMGPSDFSTLMRMQRTRSRSRFTLICRLFFIPEASFYRYNVFKRNGEVLSVI